MPCTHTYIRLSAKTTNTTNSNGCARRAHEREAHSDTFHSITCFSRRHTEVKLLAFPRDAASFEFSSNELFAFDVNEIEGYNSDGNLCNIRFSVVIAINLHLIKRISYITP